MSGKRVYVVFYYDNSDDEEPIFTIWDNVESARKQMNYLIAEGIQPQMNDTILYSDLVEGHDYV